MEVVLRHVAPILLLGVLAGCGSNWTGDDFPNPFASNPAWVDGDGDGLGDPSTPPVCIDFDDPNLGSDPRFEDGPPVRNGLDCDDAYDLSGAKLGSACPDDFDWIFGEVPDYQTVPIGGREFLVWNGSPVHYNIATMVCDSWGTLGSEVAEESGSVATLNEAFQLGEASDKITDAFGVWRGWVGLRFDPESGAWLWTGDPETDPGIPFCDGEPFTPRDVVAPASLAPEYALELEDVESEIYVLLELSEGQRCLRNPRSVAHCESLTECLEADVLCEREAVSEARLAVYELGDLDCSAR